MRSAALRSASATLLACLIVSWGCGGGAEPDLRPTLDLSARLPLALERREVTAIIPGRPAARGHLRGGFGGAWGLGESSAVRFDLLAVRDLDLALELRPFTHDGAPEQSVGVEINGTEVGRIDLDDRLETYTVRLPAATLLDGPNDLVFHYAWSRSPKSLGLSGDRRKLAVHWRRIGFADARPAAASPAADPAGGLYLPAGSQLDWYLDVSAESELRFGDAEWRGGAGGRVEVVVETDGGAAEVLASAPPGELPSGVVLTREPTVLRLGIRALGAGAAAGDGVAGDGAGPGRGGAHLSPVVWQPAEPSPSVAAAPAVATTPPTPGRQPANVLIYLVDTLRADKVGPYGSPRPVTPYLDALAAEGTVFENAVAQSSWTRASTASLLTGLWPRRHGANRRRDSLSEDAVTLAELLGEAGYRTLAVVGNPNVARTFGFGQGFDDFRFLGKRNDSHRVNEALEDWLDELEDDPRPFFLYVHAIDPHDPYKPAQEFRERFAPEVPARFAHRSHEILRDLRLGRVEVTPQVIERLLALYDGEIAANDHYFGLLLQELRDRGLDRDTVVVFVSDHGEEFYDRGGWTHGRTLNAESVRVPLVIRFPGVAQGRRVEPTVQQVDVVPTLLSYLGLPVPAGLDGDDLMPWLRDEEGGPQPERPVFLYLELDQVRRSQRETVRVAVIEGEWKYVRALEGPDAGLRELYRWREDPCERNNLVRERPVLGGWLDTLASERLLDTTGALAADEALLDPEIEESLRALGYIP